MLAIQILLFGIVLIGIPIVIGSFFKGIVAGKKQWLFQWISGQIVLWSVFLVFSIPLILLEQPFTLLCTCFSIAMAVLVVLAIGSSLRRNKCVKAVESVVVDKKPPMKGWECIFWVAAGALLLLQLILTACMAYEEGDDAFYIAVSTITESADSMYKVLPYTGRATGLDARHGLAPFPIWIAYLSRISGMAAVTIGQIVLPIVLVIMAYGIYYLIGCQLFDKQKERVAPFMILVELLVLFGGYSVYSAENFLLVRASQGKAVIANIVIPFLFYILYLLLERMQEKEAHIGKLWLVLAFAVTAGCLCSTMGTLLTCILLGVVGICMAVSYRKWKVLIPMGLCCAIPVGMAFLYLVLK